MSFFKGEVALSILEMNSIVHHKTAKVARQSDAVVSQIIVTKNIWLYWNVGKILHKRMHLKLGTYSVWQGTRLVVLVSYS